MASTAAPPITVEQYLNFEAPDGYRSELIAGAIIVSPDPKPLHHDVVLNILRILENEIGRQYKVGTRVNMNMRELFSMPSPDVFVVSHDVWRRAREGSYYPQCSPLLAVEVVSPSNRPVNVKKKTELYLSAGTLAVWNVYPVERRVMVFTQQTTEEWRPGQRHLLTFLEIELDAADFFRLD